jgi:hypothetical protein
LRPSSELGTSAFSGTPEREDHNDALRLINLEVHVGLWQQYPPHDGAVTLSIDQACISGDGELPASLGELFREEIYACRVDSRATTGRVGWPFRAGAEIRTFTCGRAALAQIPRRRCDHRLAPQLFLRPRLDAAPLASWSKSSSTAATSTGCRYTTSPSGKIGRFVGNEAAIADLSLERVHQGNRIAPRGVPSVPHEVMRFRAASFRCTAPRKVRGLQRAGWGGFHRERVRPNAQAALADFASLRARQLRQRASWLRLAGRTWRHRSSDSRPRWRRRESRTPAPERPRRSAQEWPIRSSRHPVAYTRSIAIFDVMQALRKIFKRFFAPGIHLLNRL